MHFLYALYDPREPTIARYFGRTSVSLDKRLADHLSEARYVRRHLPHKLNKRYNWILSLLDAGLRPDIVGLYVFETQAEAEAAELVLISVTFGTTTNSYRQSGGGRPLGMKESAATISKRKARWHSAARLESIPIMAEAQRARWRARFNYPRPDLPPHAPENLEHYQHLVASGFLNRTARARMRLGYPRPDLPAFAPENIEHCRKLRKQRLERVTVQPLQQAQPQPVEKAG